MYMPVGLCKHSIHVCCLCGCGVTRSVSVVSPSALRSTALIEEGERLVCFMVNSVSVSWLLPSLQLKVHSETQAQRNPLALTAELFNHLSVGLGPWISVNKHSIEIISSLLCSALSFFHTLALLSFPILLSPYPFFLFSSPQGPCVMELCFLLFDMARLITSSTESLYCVDFFISFGSW